MEKDRLATPKDIEEVVRKTFDRITWDSSVCMGQPRIKNTRITTNFIYRLSIDRWSIVAIKESYPDITTEDIAQATVFEHCDLPRSLKDWGLLG